MVAAGRQLAAEGDGREGVARVAEGRDEEAPRLPAQSFSGSSRMIRLRSSGSSAVGLVMRVPTPASR
jgi:hypothetical protein